MVDFKSMLFTVGLIITIGFGNCLQTEYFLSEDGSDDWDGISDVHIPDTNSGPWKTLLHAIQEIRHNRAKEPQNTDMITLKFLPGTYFVEQEIVLDQRDAFMTFTAWPEIDDQVVISGGLPINANEIKDKDKNVKTITFEGMCGEAFMGATRLVPARSPNGEWKEDPSANSLAIAPYHTVKGVLAETEDCVRDSDASQQNCPEENKNGFIFDKDLYSPNEWMDIDQTFVLVMHSWSAEYGKVASITETEDGDWKVIFQEPINTPVGQYPDPSGWRFLFFNNIALLDEPGEFVCIQRDENLSELSFIPPMQEEEDEPIMIAQTGGILHLKGTSHITMKGLAFRHASSEGFNFKRSQQYALRIQETTDISIQDCELSQLGMVGISIKDATRTEIVRTLFYDIGYHGIDTQHDIFDLVIKDNIFNGMAKGFFISPGAIYSAGTENITITNNEISHCPSQGINIVGHRSVSKNQYRFEISFNDIHDYGMGILSDFGGMHLGNGNGGGGQGDQTCKSHNMDILENECGVYSHVFNNLIRRGDSYTNYATGLYSDNGSGKHTFENNLLYGEGGENIVLTHHCGIDNISKNNYVHRLASKRKQSINSNRPRAALDHLVDGCESSSPGYQEYEHFNNVYLFDSMEGLAFGRPWDRYFDDSPDFYNNLYWNLSPEDGRNEKMFPDKLDWYEWQASGNDTDSRWEDPLFEDPDNHVYILKENSPAFDMGIVQIDLDHFGPQDPSVHQRFQKLKK